MQSVRTRRSRDSSHAPSCSPVSAGTRSSAQLAQPDRRVRRRQHAKPQRPVTERPPRLHPRQHDEFFGIHRRLPRTLRPNGRGSMGSSRAHQTSMISFSLPCDEIVDLLDVLVGELLHLIGAALDLIVGDRALLGERLDLVDRLVADVAHGDLVLFRLLFDQLDQVFAALFGERRDRQADRRAVDVRVEPEVARLDRLADRADDALVERGDEQRAAVGRVDARDLLERDARPVRLDVEAVEQRGRGAAGADRGEIARASPRAPCFIFDSVSR